MLTRWIAFCVGFSAAIAAPASAAGDLDAAKRAYTEVDYPRCRDKAVASLASAGTRDDRIDAHRLHGLCAAALGETEEAREAFVLMLAIDRAARLPEGLSPRFTSSFREARGSMLGKEPLALSIENSTVDEGRRIVRLRLTDDHNLVRTITTTTEAQTTPTAVKPSAVFEINVPTAVDVTIRAFDAGNGEVIRLLVPKETSEKISVIDESKPPPVVEEDSSSGLFVLGGIAAGVLLVGAGAGVFAAFFLPPQSVALKSGIAFAPPPS
jgi:hypothetical protein